jgi:hypothetical protein
VHQRIRVAVAGVVDREDRNAVGREPGRAGDDTGGEVETTADIVACAGVSAGNAAGSGTGRPKSPGSGANSSRTLGQRPFAGLQAFSSSVPG